MMRFQRVSPDCLPLSNGRKSNLRTCKEDESGENGRIPNYNSSYEGKSVVRYRSRTTPSPSRDQNITHFIFSESPQSENHGTAIQKNQNRESSPSPSPSPSRGGGDVLLQWGQNKRSRGSRAENRLAMTDDQCSVQSRKIIKIQRRVEKQGIMKQTMPPPPLSSCNTTSYSRSGNLRSCVPIRESTVSLNRNLEERSGPRNGSPSSNGGGISRVVSRSVEKRSTPSPDKTENKAGSSTGATMSEKQAPNGLRVQADPMTHHAESEQEATHVVVSGEKVNLDMFEWPRIYISLSRKEKEDDFLAMKGTKLPQRPKKRAKNVDKTLQYCFPGMWLSDLTRGRYEVREKKCVKKQKRRGLKGMESMDNSDSE